MISFSTIPTIDIPEYWYPSSVNRLANCALQFAYSRDPKFSTVLKKSNTFAALGTIAHELTEVVWKRGINDTPFADLKQLLELKWDELAEVSYDNLRRDWEGRVVPPPKDWPFYALTRSRTIRRLIHEINQHRVKVASHTGAPNPLIEHELVDEEIRLKGIPDRVTFTEDGFYVFDIKTGHSVDSMSLPYRRQLLIYAHLVRVHTGFKPLGIAVIRAGGDVIWEDISSDDVDNCIAEVTECIEKYIIAANADPLSLASPSPDVCRFCDYKATCGAFWKDQHPDWKQLRGVVGEVLEVIDQSTFRVRQIWPEIDAGREIGVSNVPSEASVGNHVAIVDGYLHETGLRGNWYTKILTVA